MPLNTQIERDGETLKMPNGWGGFHVVAMTLASVFDSGEGPFEEGRNAPHFGYTSGQYEGKTEDDYPEVPYPINPGDTWLLMGYHIIAATPLNKGEYTLQNEHAFLDTSDGEVFRLLPGDVLRCWRSMKG